MPNLEYVLKVQAELQADASVEQTTELYEMFNQPKFYTPFCEDCGDNQVQGHCPRCGTHKVPQ